MVWRKGSEALAAFSLVLGKLDEQLMEKGVHNIGKIGKDERETSHRPAMRYGERRWAPGVAKSRGPGAGSFRSRGLILGAIMGAVIVLVAMSVQKTVRDAGFPAKGCGNPWTAFYHRPGKGWGHGETVAARVALAE